MTDTKFFGDFLKNLQGGKLEGLLQQFRSELGSTMVHGNGAAGAGLVAVALTRQSGQTSTQISISDELVKESKPVLEELIAAAVDAALSDLEQKKEKIQREQVFLAAQALTDLQGEGDKPG
jgi:DNA-binding protein YbaB